MISIKYRLDRLKKLLSLWDKYESEIHLSNYLDLGQSEFTSKFTTFYQVRGEIVYAIRNLEKWAMPKKCDTPLLFCLADSYVKPEPFGLCLIFSAWNSNFLTLIIPLVQALAAGNLVVAKPASTAKETMKVCMKILNELLCQRTLGQLQRQGRILLPWPLHIESGRYELSLYQAAECGQQGRSP